MTTLSTSNLQAPAAAPAAASRRRPARVALWVTQVAVAGMFLFAGGLKLSGAPEMVAQFETLGAGQWFRYVTGGIEGLSAIALLIPSTAALGALALVPTMIGAVAAHLFVIGGSAVPAFVLLAAASWIAWARRLELSRVLARRR